MATAKATIDHGTIKRWVEEHGGCPAHVKRSGSKSDAGILRIDFPGYSGRQSLERISWDAFFDAFEENELAFLYQDEEGSRFSKLVSRDSAELDGQDGSSPARSSRGRSSETGKSASARSTRSTSSRSKAASSGGRSATKRKTSSAKQRGGSAAKASATRSSTAGKSSPARSRTASQGGKSAAAAGRATRRGNGRSTAAGKRSAANGTGRRAAEDSDAPDAISLLTEQHREVEGLFEKLESARGSVQKERVFAKLADALAAHAKIEEEIFYPSVFSRKTETELRESIEEHLVVKRLVADMLGMAASNPQFMSKASVLKEVVRHHVEEEEHQLFPEVVSTQGEEDLDELGGRMQERYEQLMAREPRKQVPKEARAASVPF